MNKLLTLMAVVISLIFLLPGTGSAATASATLTGPGTVRAGDTITLTFNLNGSSILGCEGTLSFDTGQVTLQSTSKRIASPWVFEYSASTNRFVAYDNDLKAPINSWKAIFSATFRVNSSLPAGTRITISTRNTRASDGKTEANLGTINYNATLAAPLSSNANLRSLTVRNATISPSFSTNTTSYSTTVPYTVSSLSITATPEDSAARVSISGNSLNVGRNTVSIRVTAASGATKTYTITASRQQDPDYVASDNADLESLIIDNGILSPVFEAEKTDYIVYLPFEIASFTASGIPADSKALEVTEETKELLVGENSFAVIVTAENGTSRDYCITVVRMPEYGTEPEPEVEEPETEEPEEEETGPEQEEEEEEEEPNNPGNRTYIWLILSILFLGLCLGYAGCYLLINRGF